MRSQIWVFHRTGVRHGTSWKTGSSTGQQIAELQWEMPFARLCYFCTPTQAGGMPGTTFCELTQIVHLPAVNGINKPISSTPIARITRSQGGAFVILSHSTERGKIPGTSHKLGRLIGQHHTRI